MAAQTLDQVLASLNSVYQPQLDSVTQQQAALPAQFQAQQQGLDATKDQAFGSILDDARARGSGVAFGGIPAGEQAQYLGSTYLPAVANLKTSQNQAQQSLIDAINKINEDKFTTGNNLYQFGVNQDFQQQQLAEQAREADQTAAETAAANTSTFNPSISLPTPASDSTSGGTTGSQSPDLNSKTLSGNKSTQDAYNAIQSLLATKNGGLINQTISAIQQSANYGNTYDQAKLQIISSMPEFKQYLANSNGATF